MKDTNSNGKKYRQNNISAAHSACKQSAQNSLPSLSVLRTKTTDNSSDDGHYDDNPDPHILLIYNFCRMFG